MCDVPAGRAEDSVRGVSAPEPRAAPGGLPSVERRQVGAAGQRQASERGVRAGGEGPDPAGGHCCGGQVLFNALNPVHSFCVGQPQNDDITAGENIPKKRPKKKSAKISYKASLKSKSNKEIKMHVSGISRRFAIIMGRTNYLQLFCA